MENNTTKGTYVTSMFRSPEHAENAYSVIHSRGYTTDDTSVLMSDEARKTHFAHQEVKTELGNKALEGAGTGSAIGTTLGAAVAAIAAIGTNLILPGLGLIVAGPLAAGLAGAGAGAAAGGLIGALVGAGIPEERAKVYEDGVKQGNIVLGVKARNAEDAEYFENEWRKHNAIEIHR
ncbi:MAG: hypothetical protein V4649_05385 [Bacteroidota bacterium]